MRKVLAIVLALLLLTPAAAQQRKLDLGRTGGACPLDSICTDTPPRTAADRRVVTAAWVANPGLVVMKFTGINMNTTADQQIPIVLPSGVTKWTVNAFLATNPSTSLAGSAAAGGIYTAAAKTGTAILGAGQTYTPLVVADDLQTLNTGLVTNKTFSTSPIFFSLTTAHGSAATIDLYVYLRPMP